MRLYINSNTAVILRTAPGTDTPKPLEKNSNRRQVSTCCFISAPPSALDLPVYPNQPIYRSRPALLYVFYRSNRGLNLDLESPGDTYLGAPSSIGDGPAAASAGAGGKAAAGGKTKKAAARTRRGTSRTRTAAGTGKPTGARGSSSDKVGKAATAVPAPKRKGPAARRCRAARSGGNGGGDAAAALDGRVACEESVVSSGAELQQMSPTGRRDRSPARRAAGRPERWADRTASTKKPSSPLQSPLRPITNYTSEGDRSQRSKTKVTHFSGRLRCDVDARSCVCECYLVSA